MSFSYDTSLATSKDRVRFAIGDTDKDDPQFSNEEITALLTIYGSVTVTASAAARALSAKYSREADKWVGDLKILASQKARAYKDLAESLESAATSATGVPSAGGISVAQKQAYEADTDRVAPFFKRDMFPYDSEN
jgi:hypothetical protein